MNARVLGTLVSALAFHASCASAEEPRFIDNDDKWGLVTDPVMPRWPRGRHDAAYVDIVGALTPLGKIHDETVAADRPENEAFADAVRAVLPKWKFNTPPNRQCAPSTEPVHVRVHFEDSGRVRITHEAVERWEQRMRSLERTEPLYPVRMNRDGVTARVYARAEVAPDGSVTSVRVRAFSTRLASEGNALLPFEVEVTRAMKKWKFTPAPEGEDRVRVACQIVSFNLD